MTLNRTQAPATAFNENLDFLKAETTELSNGIPLHRIKQGDQKLMRLQFVFPAGRVYSSNPVLPAAVNDLLQEGTQRKTGAELAELFESKGAFLESELQADTAGLNLYALCGESHLSDLKTLLLLIKEIILESNFPKDEFIQYQKLKLQEFQLNSRKVSFVAKNHFSPFLLGENHPYANFVEVVDFQKMQRKDLLYFYEKQYRLDAMELYLAGGFNDPVVELIEEVFAAEPSVKKMLPDFPAVEAAVKEQSGANEKYLPMEGALQSAIRIGSCVIGKQDPDFVPLYAANAILGGYFGSRLMSNIREDKGYTYGIGSQLVVHRRAAYFILATEVGAKHTKKALHEIFVEINRLAEELVGDAELQLVKNYLRGKMLRSFDGAFAAMDRFRSLRNLGLDYTYYQNFFKGLSQVDSEAIQFVSKKYLNENQLKIVVAGKKN